MQVQNQLWRSLMPSASIQRRSIASLEKGLAPKTRRNVHATMRSFWRWAVAEGYAERQIMDGIRPPKAEQPLIEPFSEEDVRAMLLFLVDTGVRASELCDLRFEDVNLEAGTATIQHGKGNKKRHVSFGKRTRQAIWRYWAEREDLGEKARVFATVLDGERPLERRVLGRLCTRIGQRAGVRHAFPHRYRHTFAITFLRNGGDIFSLQELLGHTDLDMVRRYLAIATSDTERVHAQASPVDNWRL